MPARAELPVRLLELLRKVTPFAYCDTCLAPRVNASLDDVRDALAALGAEGAVERARRVCYGCRRTVELSVVGPRSS